MASLIENLIGVLEKETVQYKELLELSRTKTDAIVHNRVDELQDILGTEQKMITQLDALERAREEHIDDIANVLNVPVAEMKIARLIKLMEKQPKDQALLIKVHDELKSVVDQLVKVNDNNKVLLQESLGMLEFEMNLVRNSKLAPTTNNYGKNAYSASDSGYASQSFDAKQ